MAIPLDYVARETASNLWRNRVMALAGIAIVAVSLALVGTALVLRQSVARQIVALGDNVNVQIFVQASASGGELSAIRMLIHQTPQIKSCGYLDHQQSYQRMRSLFADEPTVAGVLTPATTPPVFECDLINPNDAPVVKSVFVGVPGVFSVSYPQAAVRSWQRLANIAQTICLVMAIVLLVCSLVLILNAIRMAIFSRRREIGVMKLVGATNWFIRVPFMLEGLVQGLLGSMVAVLFVLLANLGVHSLLGSSGMTSQVQPGSSTLLSPSNLPAGQLFTTEAIILVIGLIVGVAGSSVAVRRFLDV